MTLSSGEDPPDFEGALQRLEAIVHDLERGEIGLDEALSHYEQGVTLLRRCYQLLHQVEQKIELLTGVDADGNPLTAPFDASATTGQLAARPEEASNPLSRSSERAVGPAPLRRNSRKTVDLLAPRSEEVPKREPPGLF